MAARPVFGLVSLVLVAGSILLILLVLLAGAISSSPVDGIYFLEADTSSIPGAMPISRWTFWNLCGDTNGVNTNCGKVTPAFPLDPQSNFASQNHVPQGFIGNNQYYYMSRVTFAFTLITLFFDVLALFVGLLALCSRIGAFASSLLSLAGLVSQSVVVALMTSVYIMARDTFNRNNMAASIGNEAFGFLWGAWGCLFFASVLFCVGGTASKDRHERRSLFSSRSKKSNRDRGSFGHDAETSSFVRG